MQSLCGLAHYDFNMAGTRAASMKRGRAETIVREVRQTIACWQNYADAAGVPPAWRDRIHTTLRLENF